VCRIDVEDKRNKGQDANAKRCLAETFVRYTILIKRRWIFSYTKMVRNMCRTDVRAKRISVKDANAMRYLEGCIATNIAAGELNSPTTGQNEERGQ